jgi:hypothetical protein
MTAFSDREFPHIAPILAGLAELGAELPREIGAALKAWERLDDELGSARIEAGAISPGAVAERSTEAFLAAAQAGEPLPDLRGELAEAEAALRWRTVQIDALAAAQAMAAGRVAASVSRSSASIYGLLRASLAAIMDEVRKLEPQVRGLPLGNPDQLLRGAGRAQIEAYQRLSREADRLAVVRELQFQLRRAAGGGSAGADFESYARPIARSSRPENRLERLLWIAVTPGVAPVVRSPQEAVAAEKEVHEARRRGQEVAA